MKTVAFIEKQYAAEIARIEKEINTLVTMLSQEENVALLNKIVRYASFEVGAPHIKALFYPEEGWYMYVYGTKCPEAFESSLYKYSLKELRKIKPLHLYEVFLHELKKYANR